MIRGMRSCADTDVGRWARAGHVADAITVTTARSLGAGNAREFARVPGLQFEDWGAGG